MSAAMKAAALFYARSGWPLVPLSPGTKKPLVKTGTDHAEAATCDVGQVERWWTNWPIAGIGIIPAAGGFVVVDVDDRHAFLDHRAAGHDYPLTACSISGRDGGGFHLWYRLPPGAPVPRGRIIAPGLELKAAGNLVVAPPSRHKSGRRYRWDVPPVFLGRGGFPVDPAHPPGWMLDTPPRLSRTAELPAAPASLGGAVATPYGAKAMRDELDRLAMARRGERHRTLWTVAWRLAELAAGGHLDPADMRGRLVLAAEHAFGGEDEPGEIDNAVAWAFEKGGLT